MNLNKLFVAVFVFLGFFSMLLVTMPTQFQSLGITSEVQDKEAADFFNQHNITMYNYTWSLNITYPGTESKACGLPEGQLLEFWWGLEWIDLHYKMLELRHLTKQWWWWAHHKLAVDEPYSASVSYPEWGLRKQEVLDLFDSDKNASYCEFSCDHLAVKLFILAYNASWTLEQSWNNGQMKLYTSYDIDWTKTGTSMWIVLWQLLSFQSPSLGIPGLFGSILGYGLALTLWGCIAILIWAVVTAIIPFIPGWKGGG